MPETYDIVHTVTDYYDGPKRGIADFKGVPHFYESRWDEQDDGTGTFMLQPIDDETFKLAMEDWDIWKRWRGAFDRHEATIETHPALPLDRARHDEIAAIVAPKLRVLPDIAFQVRGRFTTKPHGTKHSQSGWIVYWSARENVA